jgi:hypothetical protein
MTPQAKQRARTATAVAVPIATLILYGNWVKELIAPAKAAPAPPPTADTRFVTEERWRADSTRRDEQFRQLIGELRDTRTETGARLREICVAVRAGCR